MNESDPTNSPPRDAAWPSEVGERSGSTLEPIEPEISRALSTLRFLQPLDITSIERALRKVGPDGEIRLTVEDGRLFSIHALTSEPLDRGYPPLKPGGGLASGTSFR